VDYPPFDDAVCRFEAFLRHCGAPTDICWVAFPDVAWVDRLYVRPRPRDQAVVAARWKYERSVPRLLGVKLAALGRSGAASYCYVYRPSSRIEAEYSMMPDGLKLSVRDSLPEVVVVADAGEWHRLRTRDLDWQHKRFLLS
jgi:hypothetical protein